MTTTAGSSEQIDAYLAAVRASLADLAEDERADLLAEVEASLLEAAGETDRPFAALGPPEAFAAELRASAGLGEPTPFDVPSASIFDSIRVFARELGARPEIARALRAGRELAPIWWLVRGYLGVVLLASVTNASWSDSRPWLPAFSSARSGALAIAVAVVASLVLGLLGRRRASALLGLVLLVDLAAVIAIVPAVNHATGAPRRVFVTGASPQTPAVAGIANSGRAVRNVYAYSRDGKMLHDVRLYDDLGNPLVVELAGSGTRRLLVDAFGAQVSNAYPIRYYASGTRIVAHPNAGPRIRVPKILTPPLP